MTLHLHNPHSVLAALAHRPQDVLEIRLSPAPPSAGWKEVVEAAKAHGIPIHTRLASDRRHERQADREGRQGACEGLVRELAGIAVEDLFPSEPGNLSTGLWLALDCLQDPQNVGAIFRTAAFFGVRGIIATRDRSAPLNAAVYDVASGGIELVPFSQPSNLARALEIAKQAGVWILGSSEHAPRAVAEIPRDRPWLLVLGSEEQGLRRLTQDSCDDVCCLRPRGELQSLNVSAAAAVLISELSR